MEKMPNELLKEYINIQKFTKHGKHTRNNERGNHTDNNLT